MQPDLATSSVYGYKNGMFIVDSQENLIWRRAHPKDPEGKAYYLWFPASKHAWFYDADPKGIRGGEHWEAVKLRGSSGSRTSIRRESVTQIEVVEKRGSRKA